MVGNIELILNVKDAIVASSGSDLPISAENFSGLSLKRAQWTDACHITHAIGIILPPLRNRWILARRLEIHTIGGCLK